MNQKPDKLLLIALLVGLVFHGTTFFFTFDSTYDAFVHIFFADHYARSWFEPWDNRWYTGFNVTSYPPLVHQLTALLSKPFGLRYGFVFLAIGIVQLLIIGAYRFSKLWTNTKSAGYAAIYTCFASSIVEAMHLFGQLPTLMGISCLLNALPEIYRFIRYGKIYRLLTGVSIMAVGVTSHHVTTIFGMVFFVAPVVGLAVIDSNNAKQLEKKKAELRKLNLPTDHVVYDLKIGDFITETLNKWKELMLFGACVPIIMMFVFPYFYWSKTDPINQVSIPHGSRDSFIKVPSSGLMFFLIPMGINLLLLPYIFSRVWTKRNFFIGLSFTLLVLFGTGGTTPIPKLMLGTNAFNILTLDRFTFWATIISIPFVGEFFNRLINGDFKEYLIRVLGKWPHRAIWFFFSVTLALLTIFIINLGNFRPMQPAKIDMKPIAKFLETDQHDKWRFLTLGFGDQMAWLSAQTTAQSVDGNYHSARRLPEMTTRPLERLENSKFKGIQGLGSLQQFLTVPEKYHLKFAFSNDKFYDPILYFSGWERLSRLENGIMLWQKQDVPPLPSALPSKNLPQFVKIYWGVMPLFALLMAFSINLLFLWYTRIDENKNYEDDYRNHHIVLPALKPQMFLFLGIWINVIVITVLAVIIKLLLMKPNDSPTHVIESYYDALDFKEFRKAYSFFDLKNKPTFNDYFMKLSVEDGIVASYAKLDNIKVKLEKINPTKYKAFVTTEWITPVEQYFIKYEHIVNKHGTRWYIEAPKFDLSIPADAYVSERFLSLHSQGKRQANEEPTQHDDVIDRPELRIINARLVKNDTAYSVVGAIQNIDNQPAHLTVEAILYDKYDRKLVSYNPKYGTIHRIMPKEQIPFRIDFEATAWVQNDDLDPGHFNPGEQTVMKFSIPPAKFNIFARAVFDKNDLYRSGGIQMAHINGNELLAEAINFGTDEISVPKVLIAYLDQNEKVKWVETFFMREGIRQERKRKIRIPLANFSKYNVVYEGTERNFFVNGLPNETYLIPNFKKNLDVKIPYKNKESVSLFIDNYIGNPTIY